MNVIYRVYKQINALFRRFGFGIHLILFPRDFSQDGLVTSRVRTFEDDSEFLLSKQKTIDTIGFDFEIDWRTNVFLWCLRSTSHLTGWAVELGTGKAWMFTFANNHNDFANLEKVHLIDRFSSLAVDKGTGIPIPGTSHSSYSDDPESIRNRFHNRKDFIVTQGELPQVLNQLDIDQLRFLHVDLNAAAPEVASLKILWPRLVPGAIVLLDDFGSPEFSDSRLAMIELSKELSFTILGLPTGQGMIIKQ